MLRIIREVRPRYIFMENVSVIVNRGMGTVLGGLAESGYNARWKVLSAAEVGAHHNSKRWWCLATSTEADSNGRLRSQPIYETTRLGGWSKEQFEGLLRIQTQLSVPAGRYGRLSDGISNRTHRLRCLGNSVVPQQARKAFEILMENE